MSADQRQEQKLRHFLPLPHPQDLSHTAQDQALAKAQLSSAAIPAVMHQIVGPITVCDTDAHCPNFRRSHWGMILNFLDLS